ncbi:MAG: NnrU family protein [Rhodoferax sp.]|uniref:NnrU family protein n=1 Tax=Rhodoferax sp. TaxID=50421 RepID=UPI00263116B3|nr:NnrU family protein [Rhodoferax sp.]MDD2881633.1 NnrU family protein [Rhodoferax sp.]
MNYLLAGLTIFFGAHSVRLFADGWRTRVRNRLGAQTWRAGYSLLSLTGFCLIVWGFGLVRQAPMQLWIPPTGMRHLAALLTLLAFVLLAAAYVPGNQIKARVHHPMLAGVKLWALAHLLANGNLGHVVLFGTFLVWAVLCYLAAGRRDRLEGTVYSGGQTGATGVTVALGVAGWIAFTLWLHGWLIGVRPFG